MEKLNLFIIASNLLVAISLKTRLNKYFGDLLSITTFNNKQNLLQNPKQADIIIVYHEHNRKGKKAEDDEGDETIKSIKAMTPNTKVVLLINKDQLEDERSESVTKNNNYNILDNYLLTKINFMGKVADSSIKYTLTEYNVITFMFVFFTTFISIGLLVFLIVKYF